MEAEKEKKKTKQTRSLPMSQFDILTLAKSVLSKWEENTQITLMWISVKEFKQLVADYDTTLAERVDAGSGRGLRTQTLKELDAQINNAVEEVKIATQAKFGREKGKAYFGEFGITKQSSRAGIPTDRNQRINALPLLAKGVKQYSLTIVGFDAAFFEGITEQYDAAMQAAQTIDSNVSVSVGNKNELRKQIENVLSALKALVKINYPQTYEGEWRGWGFQKEKF